MADPLNVLRQLQRAIYGRKGEIEHMYAYYEGRQPLRFAAPAALDALGAAYRHLVINWPELIVDAYDERSDIEGFRLGGEASEDRRVRELWQVNDGDEKAPEAHNESLVAGCAYVIVGPGEGADDAPVFSVESGLQCAVERDPRTRRARYGVKLWQDVDDQGRTVHWGNVYLPDRRLTYVRRPRSRAWELDSEWLHEHVVGPLIVPLPNRGRIRVPDGRSEFASVVPLADAANKVLVDMMSGVEHHAFPRRWVLGMTEDDFVDERGEKLPTWEAIVGKLWGTDKKPGEVEFGQFPESDLRNFHETLRLLAQLVSQLAGLPKDYMSFASDNPTSADAIRAEEARFVKRCERKHVAWGGAWEEVMRLLLQVDGRPLDTPMRSMEAIWRDPATPTRAQLADATVKLAGGRPIIPVEQAREDLGYTDVQRENMRRWDREALALDPVQALADQFRAPEVSGGVASGSQAS